MSCAQVQLPRSLKFKHKHTVLLSRGGGGTLCRVWGMSCAQVQLPRSLKFEHEQKVGLGRGMSCAQVQLSRSLKFEHEQVERLGRVGGGTICGGGNSFRLLASFGVPG